MIDMRWASAIVSGVICAVTTLALAGPVEAQGLGYGVKVGVNLADLQEKDSGGEPSPFGFRTGLVAGGFVSWPLGTHLDLQPEVLFTQKGATSDQGGGTATQKLDYVDVPLLVSYRLFGERGRHVAVFGGPSIGVRVRARSSASFGGDSLERDISDEVARGDLAVVGGLAYHRGRFVVDGRYSWGVSDIDREADDGIEIRTRGISLLVGWTF